ncbi:hypothetical protein LUZ63_019261 [Rhynchospora breviuscula]|uniref:Uncharacterized protein n=1 Tax=Rhynchospora breviuscula TaxID=2022672 RepID=A0A9Q0C5V9_9POAL|nr:hypothetical protein LUZ63_019261 [Rhynchospora breviuscula]
MASQPTGAPPPPTPPPQQPPPQPPSAAKKGFLRRIFPLLIVANLAVGVYVLTRTGLKDKKTEEEASTENKSLEKTSPEIAPPVPAKKELPPIPPEEQLQLFKWILQEKRKVKTRDPVEKKKIDEDKALLKDIIRSGSIPSL